MLYLVLAALMWGSSFPVIRYALGDVSPMLFVILRFAVAFVVISAISRVGFRHMFRRDVFILSLMNAASFVLQFKAQELTTASKTALFVNSSPVFVVLLTLFLPHRTLGKRQLVATVVAMAGIVTTSTGLDLSGLGDVNTGDVLAVGTGLCWAFFILASRGAVEKHGAYRLAQGLYFWTMLLTLPLIPTEPVRFSWNVAPAIGYLAVFATVLAYFGYLRGVRQVTAVATSIIILIEVVVAFGISYVFLGESFSAVEAAGVALVLSGVVLASRR
jgi:drug/metabolite transporter (DMT)-like permease